MSTMEHGVVAILDALGVKGIWARQDPKTVITKWNTVIDNFKEFKKLHNEDDEAIGKSKVFSFSDTIIITYVGNEDDELQLLNDMGLHLSLPFCDALLDGIFFRGVISKGKFKQTSRMIIGPAIDEAMSWFERHDWMGISLAPSTSFALDEYENDGNKMKWFTRYNVPVKHGISLNNGIDKNTWVLNWPNTLEDSNAIQDLDVDPKSALLNAFSQSPIGPDAISKYKNTIDFYDSIMNKQKK